MSKWEIKTKEEFYEENKLPKNAELIGYAIYREDTEELLARRMGNAMIEVLQWTRLPPLAELHKTPLIAERILKRLEKRGPKVVGLIKLDDDFIVLEIGKN